MKKTLLVSLLFISAAFADDKKLSDSEKIEVLQKKVYAQAVEITTLSDLLKYYQGKAAVAQQALTASVDAIQKKHNCTIMDDLSCKEAPKEDKK